MIAGGDMTSSVNQNVHQSIPICMWSGPRNLSTAMMRSFGSRADCAVWDEPFFAPYLHFTGKPHPGREETLAAHETDPLRVAAACAAPAGQLYFFQKHMPHHMLAGFPMEWAARGRDFFLIRPPARGLASYAKGRAEFDLEDLGYTAQSRLYEQLSKLQGLPPPIVDCDDILRAPEPLLRALCGALEMPFDPAMLGWAAGPRETDGAWAPHWYASVEASTGFSGPPKTLPEISPRRRALYEACWPAYEALYKRRLVASP